MVAYDLAVCKLLAIGHLPDGSRLVLQLDALLCSSDRFKVAAPHLLAFRPRVLYQCSLRVVLDQRQAYFVRPVVLVSRFSIIVFSFGEKASNVSTMCGSFRSLAHVGSPSSQRTCAILIANSTFCGTLGYGMTMANEVRRGTPLTLLFDIVRSTRKTFEKRNLKGLLRPTSCMPFVRRTP